jgi:hypothetical protein
MNSVPFAVILLGPQGIILRMKGLSKRPFMNLQDTVLVLVYSIMEQDLYRGKKFTDEELLRTSWLGFDHDTN